MKLNYKRTILVGFAFFLISAFWQAYDATIPVILTNKFGMSQTWSGLIMAIDNILAVFMLPIFGSISDKCRSPKGKRTPFITIGSIIAAIALVSLSVVDIVQLKNVSDVAKIDDPAALSVIYDKQADTTLKTPEGKEFILSELMDKETFVSIRSQIVEPSGEKSTSKDYTNYKTYDNSTIAANLKASALAGVLSDAEIDAIAARPEIQSREFVVKELSVKAEETTVFGHDFRID
jgi:hypothetical protein